MEIDNRYSNESNGPPSEEVRDLMEEYVIAHKFKEFSSTWTGTPTIHHAFYALVGNRSPHGGFDTNSNYIELISLPDGKYVLHHGNAGMDFKAIVDDPQRALNDTFDYAPDSGNNNVKIIKNELNFDYTQLDS